MIEQRETQPIPRENFKLVIDFLLANKDKIEKEQGIDVATFLNDKKTTFRQKKELFISLENANNDIDITWEQILAGDNSMIRAARKAWGIKNRVPLSLFTSLAETTIADRDENIRSKYAELLEGGLYQKEFKQKLKHDHEVPSKKIKTYIENQSADQYRSIIELTSNAIDFSNDGGSVDISISETGFSIKDSGSGMKAHDIFEKLVVPYMSGARGKKASIGKFGLGFFTIFNHLKSSGDKVILRTSGNGSAFRITFSYEDGEIYVETEDDVEIKTGTEVELLCKDFDKDIAKSTLKKSIRFKQGIDINLTTDGETEKINNTERYQGKVIKHSELEQTNSLIDFQSETNSSGLIFFLVNGVLTEDHRIEGINIPLELVVDFPHTTELPESRNEIALDQVVFNSVKSLIDKVSISDITPTLVMQEINGLAEVINILSSREQMGKNQISELYEELRRLVSKIKSENPNVIFVPAIPGIETIQFDNSIIPISILIEKPDLDMLPNINLIKDFESGELLLFTSKIDSSKTPIIVFDNVIILSEDVYNHHSKYPGALEKYIELYFRIKLDKYVFGKFKKVDDYDPDSKEAKIRSLKTESDSSVQESTMLRDDFINFLDLDLEDRLKADNDEHDYEAISFKSLLAGDKPFGFCWISDDLKIELTKYLMGIDENCLIQQLIEKEISIEDLLEIINSREDDDRYLKLFIKNGDAISNLIKLKEIFEFFQTKRLESIFEYPIDERISEYLKLANNWLKQEFSEDSIVNFEIDQQNPELALNTIDEFIERIRNSWRVSGSLEKISIIFFLVSLKQSLLTLISSCNEETLYEEKPGIKKFATHLKSVDWRDKNVLLRGKRLLKASASIDKIAELVIETYPELESYIIELLKLHPMISRITILNLLLLMLNPVGFVEMSLNAGSYGDWEEKINRDELSKPSSDIAYDVEIPRSEVLEKMMEISVLIPEIIKSMLISTQRIQDIPFMKKLLETRGDELVGEMISHPQYFEIFALGSLITKPEIYVHPIGSEQLDILNVELEATFNISTMSKDEIEKLVKILQDFNKYSYLDIDRFKLAIKILCCDIKRSTGTKYGNIYPPEPSLSEEVFELVYENGDVFESIQINNFVDLLGAVTGEPKEFVLNRRSVETSKKIIKIFTIISRKSAKERIELLEAFRKPPKGYETWGNYFYFQRQAYSGGRTNIDNIPENIKPYVVMFFDNNRTQGIDNEIDPGEMSHRMSLVDLSLSRMLNVGDFSEQVSNPKEMPEFVNKETSKKDKIVQQRELLHAVHHLPTNDPYLFVREMLQNSIDIIGDSGGGQINIRDFFQDERFVVEVNDSVGMSPQTVIGDLLIAGESTKDSGRHLGRFGIGFFSVLRGAEKVEIVTGDSIHQTTAVIIPIYDENNMVVDFEMSYTVKESSLQGTKIRKYMSIEDGEIEGAKLKTAVSKYAKYVDSKKYEVVLNDKKVSSASKVLSDTSHPDLGDVSILESSGEKALVQGNLFVSDLPKWISDMIPSRILELLKENGMVLNLGKKVELIRTRNDLAGRERYVPALRQVIMKLTIDAIVDLFSRDKLSLEILPYDFFWKSNTYDHSVDHQIQKDADKLNEGVEITDYERYENRENLIQLLTLRKIFTINDELVSMIDIAKMIKKDSQINEEKLPIRLVELIKDSRYKEIRTKERQREMQRSGMKEISRIDPEKFRDIADVYLAYSEIIRGLTHPDLRDRGINFYYSADGSHAHASSYSGERGEKAWNLHDDVRYGLYSSLDYLSKFLKDPSSVEDENISFIFNSIFEISTHEDAHLLAGNSCRSSRWYDTHNKLFFEAQLKVMEEVLKNSNPSEIVHNLIGKYKGTNPYFKRSDLLREIGFFDN